MPWRQAPVLKQARAQSSPQRMPRLPRGPRAMVRVISRDGRPWPRCTPNLTDLCPRRQADGGGHQDHAPARRSRRARFLLIRSAWSRATVEARNQVEGPITARNASSGCGPSFVKRAALRYRRRRCWTPKSEAHRGRSAATRRDSRRRCLPKSVTVTGVEAGAVFGSRGGRGPPRPSGPGGLRDSRRRAPSRTRHLGGFARAMPRGAAKPPIAVVPLIFILLL